MPAVRLTVLIPWQLLAVLGSEVAALEGIPVVALQADDECRDGHPGPCALNALQYRAQPMPGKQGASRNFGYKSTRTVYARIPPTPKSSKFKAQKDTELGSSELPKDHDWRNINGQSLVLGTDVEMDQALYDSSCGTCYIYATLSALSDRIKIMRKGAFPDVTLSRQAVLSCLPNGADGEVYGCSGGDPWVIHEYLYEAKIPDSTCTKFKNKETACPAGGPMEMCEFCMGPALPTNLPKNFSLTNKKISVPCFHTPAKSYPGYGVSNYGEVDLSEFAMMKEIYENGPITCALVADDPFTYTDQFLSNAGIIDEGVYISAVNFTQDDVNHMMEVTGWGETESGRKYWVMRNSWGTVWGSMGWAKLERGVNAQMIEAAGCHWATPDFEELDNKLKSYM